LADHPTGRSAMTCAYRCGNACAHPAPNTSDNEYFGDIATDALAGRLSRRGLLRASAVGALAAGVAGVSGGVALPAAAANETSTADGEALTFPAVPPNKLDSVVVPNGYDHAVVIRWGDPVVPGAPSSTRTSRACRRSRSSSGTTTTTWPSSRWSGRGTAVRTAPCSS